MERDIMMAGHGGQGVKSLGYLLGHAATKEGKNALLYNVYGAQIRGGPISSAIVISDAEIGSPLRTRPWALIAMNQSALDLYESQVQPRGIILINSSTVARPVKRDDVEVMDIPANDLAMEMGDIHVAAMIAMGAFIEKTGIISLSTAKEVLTEVLPTYRHQLLPLNRRALDAGARRVRELG